MYGDIWPVVIGAAARGGCVAMWRALASRVRCSIDVPSKHEQGADGEGHAYLGGDELARAPVVYLRMKSTDGVRWRPGGVSAAAP